MVSLRVLLIPAAVVSFLAGCGGSGQIDCGGPVKWESVDATVVSVGNLIETDDQAVANVVLRYRDRSNRIIGVWGRPDLLEVGAEYDFEITNKDEAFFEYSGVPLCYYPEFRRSERLP